MMELENMELVLNDPDRRLLQELEVLINLELKNHKPLPFYCDKLGISVHGINNLTQLYYGRSLHEVLTLKLLACSKYYVSSTSLSLKWITYELGFEDPAYFSKWFKKWTGENPRAYRRKNFRLKVVDFSG